MPDRRTAPPRADQSIVPFCYEQSAALSRNHPEPVKHRPTRKELDRLRTLSHRIDDVAAIGDAACRIVSRCRPADGDYAERASAAGDGADRRAADGKQD